MRASWECELSVYAEVSKRVPQTPDDGYNVLLDMELSELSPADRELFGREAQYCLSLYRTYGHKAVDVDFCDEKIMERFAAEEAARS
jgi:hypothetical protein